MDDEPAPPAAPDPMEQLKQFRQLHAKTAGHPAACEFPGIETTTGPLGQGLANAVGMALADPQKYLQSPGAVAHFGAVAAAPTTSVPVIVDEKSGATGKVAAVASSNDAATLVASKKKRDTTLSGAGHELLIRPMHQPANARRRINEASPG